VLTERVKPLFQASSHPQVNLETGRKLLRPAGGPESSIDMFETQVWKKHLGICGVLTSCIEHIDTADFEALWPLLIPPLMTIMDDREAKWRLRVLVTVLTFVDLAPPELLRRTGVHQLLSTVSHI
jgi:hypothetical protein